MRILFVTGVFENDATGAARFAKLIHDSENPAFTILSEDTKGGEGILKMSIKPKLFEIKLWQYFRIKYYREKLHTLHDSYDAFVFNNSIMAFGFKTDKPCFVFVHDEKLMRVNPTFRFDYLRKMLLRKIEKKVLESDIHIISNSRHISNRILETYNVKKSSISLLYQGIDLSDKESQFTNYWKGGVVKIMFVKNDFVLGGLLELVDALSLLSDYSFQLTIYGSSRIPNDMLPARDFIDYDIKGIRPNAEVVRSMYDHHLLCIPARVEPLGVAVMEGLAVGIPTVTTDVGGLPEVTNDGKHIWSCKPHDARSIAKQIKACLENLPLSKEKSIAGKRHVHTHFDFDQVVGRLINLISEKSISASFDWEE